MEYRLLGETGFKVPVLSLGTATFGGSNDFFKAWGSTDADGARSLVDIALEAGVSMFDSADVYSAGMAEEILDVLAKIPRLTVISRTSSFQFKGRDVDAKLIGSTLGSRYIVEGSVRKSGDRVRITAQLTDTRDGSRRWSETYDRSVGDAFKVQDEIATSLDRALQLAVGAGEMPARWLSHAPIEGHRQSRQQDEKASITARNRVLTRHNRLLVMA